MGRLRLLVGSWTDADRRRLMLVEEEGIYKSQQSALGHPTLGNLLCIRGHGGPRNANEHGVFAISMVGAFPVLNSDHARTVVSSPPPGRPTDP